MEAPGATGAGEAGGGVSLEFCLDNENLLGLKESPATLSATYCPMELKKLISVSVFSLLSLFF